MIAQRSPPVVDEPFSDPRPIERLEGLPRAGAIEHAIDVAVQPERLQLGAKRLVMLDAQLGDTDYHLSRIMADLAA